VKKVVPEGWPSNILGAPYGGLVDGSVQLESSTSMGGGGGGKSSLWGASPRKGP